MLERLLSRRSLLTFCIVSTIFFLTSLSNTNELINSLLTRRDSIPPLEVDNEFRQQLSLIRPSDKLPHSRTLGIADAMFVVSLARRTDRREVMDSIANALDLDFTYIDATDFKTPKGRQTINRIRSRVRWQRNRLDDQDALPSDFPTPNETISETYIFNAFPFKWSADAEKNKDDPLAEPLGIAGADYWDMDPPNEDWEKAHPLPPWTAEERKASVMEASVMNNQNRKRWITDAAFSCWHSHYRTIKEIVRRQLKAAIILEDDIDLEWNIEKILRKQWPALPDDWDIVYLGHCWSEEWRGEALAGAPMLRKTYHNLCTHAYVLSLRGATKVLRYFRSPDYAYSRPVDHGYKDLIQMHLLNSYSVYPPVSVQTKDGISDIVNSIETVWKKKEGLTDSTLERIELYKNMTERVVDYEALHM